MIPPSFIEEFSLGPRTVWLLKEDAWINPAVKKAGRLNWDDAFLPVSEKLNSSGRAGSVIDVGAFIGDTTEWFFGKHKLYTFEPQRDAFTCLVHNIPGATHFPYPAGNGETVDLDTKGNEEGNLGGRGVRAGASCPTIRIDDLGLSDVALIKIDAEGWEPNVLAGAAQTIERCKPIVAIEVNVQCLVARGFSKADILGRFDGWNSVVFYQYSEEQYDVMFYL